MIKIHLCFEYQKYILKCIFLKSNGLDLMHFWYDLFNNYKYLFSSNFFKIFIIVGFILNRIFGE